MSKKNPFTVNEDGSKYVEVKAIMSTMTALLDNIQMFQFSGSKKSYMELQRAIDWVKQEMTYCDDKRYPEMLRVLIKFSESTVTYQDGNWIAVAKEG